MTPAIVSRTNWTREPDTRTTATPARPGADDKATIVGWGSDASVSATAMVADRCWVRLCEGVLYQRGPVKPCRASSPCCRQCPPDEEALRFAPAALMLQACSAANQQQPAIFRRLAIITLPNRRSGNASRCPQRELARPTASWNSGMTLRKMSDAKKRGGHTRSIRGHQPTPDKDDRLRIDQRATVGQKYMPAKRLRRRTDCRLRQSIRRRTKSVFSRQVPQVFIESKNSEFCLVWRSLSIRNSIASCGPIGLRMRRST